MPQTARFDLEPLRDRITEWMTGTQGTAAREESGEPIDPDTFARNDDEAAAIVHAVAGIMGIGDTSTWTVDLHDTTRHDGEGPFVYVVQAHTADDAKAFAALWHAATQTGDPDIVLQCHEGLPQHGGAWQDLRGKTRADIDVI